MTLELTLDLDWATRWRGMILEMRPWRDKSKVRTLRLWEPGVEGAATLR